MIVGKNVLHAITRMLLSMTGEWGSLFGSVPWWKASGGSRTKGTFTSSHAFTAKVPVVLKGI